MRYLILTLLLSSPVYADSVERIKGLIFVHAIANGINPNLALAIAKNESKLNPKARGSLGEIGVFQLRPEFHKGNIWNTEQNIIIGIKYLKSLEKRFVPKYGDAWFISYNLGPNYPKTLKYPKKFQYYVRVQKQLHYIAMGE